MTDITQELDNLAEKLRDKDRLLSSESLLCQRAAGLIRSQEAYLNLLKSRLMEQHTHQRIATALEQSAMHGWGNVPGENLLDNAPAQPVGEDS